MNKFFYASFLCLLLPLAGTAQKSVSYGGPQIRFQDNTLKVWKLCDDPRTPEKSFQGMDIWGNTMISLRNYGWAVLMDFNGKKATRKGVFKLASWGHDNHANVASFSNQFYKEGDKLPLLYVTRCFAEPDGRGMDKLAYVERIDPDKMESSLVQKIWFNDETSIFGGTTQWVIDRQNNFLYAYGNSRRTDKDVNTHPIMKFRIPPYRGAQDSLVILTREDALECYHLEDSYTFAYQPIIQGAYIKNGLAFFPCGVGHDDQPSILFVWNLQNRSMQNVINLQKQIPNEMEDCAEYDGDLIMQCQKEYYRISFPK